MAQITKLYENTTDETIYVQGIGDIPAGDRLSVVSEYPTPVNLANFPGIVEVSGLTDEEHKAKVAEGQAAYKAWKATNPGQPTLGVRQQVEEQGAAPAQPANVQGASEIETNTGDQTNA